MSQEGVQEQRAVLGGQAEPVPARPGEFEILAITAGEGNGWRFPARVLEESLPLWDGAETFIDHGTPPGAGRSIRDLAGVCSQPVFDARAGGIRLVLKPAGPSAALLESLGKDWLNNPPDGSASRPRIGFSADIAFTARGREVERILKVISIDLVYNPARGGAFIRQMSREADQDLENEGGFMEPEKHTSVIEEPAGEEARLAWAQLARLKEETCACLLEAELASARLPQEAACQLRQRFNGRIYEPQELKEEIQKARSLAGSLQSGAVVSGPRISEMITSEEHLQAAVDDLFGAQREVQMQGRRVERLSGIRELYLRQTGDYDMNGTTHQEQLANTASMPALVMNSLNKLLVQKWEELGRAGYRWWESVVTVEHFDSLQTITGAMAGEVGDLPIVEEGGEYTELPIADSSETGTWVKYGGYLPLTIELIDRDNLAVLKSYPHKLAVASLRQISKMVAGMFTQNSGTGPKMADSHNVFDAENHGNLGSSALSAASWEAAGQAIYKQKMLAGGLEKPSLSLDPKYLLVPRSLRLTGMRILYPSWERESGIVSENMQKGEYGDVITVPEWTDTDDWAAVVDPRLVPGIIVGERFGLRPEIFIAGDPASPALFANDELRLKIRHFISVFAADYRPLYKSNYE